MSETTSVCWEWRSHDESEWPMQAFLQKIISDPRSKRKNCKSEVLVLLYLPESWNWGVKMWQVFKWSLKSLCSQDSKSWITVYINVPPVVWWGKYEITSHSNCTQKTLLMKCKSNVRERVICKYSVAVWLGYSTSKVCMVSAVICMSLCRPLYSLTCL